MSSKSSGSSGIGILGLLGVVFVTLKLTGSISWSWWWVTAPFWGGLALSVIFFIAIVTVSLIYDVVKSGRKS